jgi:ferric enterobactin receptor
MRPIFTFIFLLVSIWTIAQKASVSGTLTDQQTNEALPYGTISFTKMGQSPNAVLSDANGKFNLSLKETGAYKIRVSYIGYELFTDSILVKEGINNLGILPLKTLQKQLNEVSVVGQKAAITTTLDKQSYSAAQFDAAKGGTALDVLRNMPSVSVNAEGEISMRGSKGFMILVNGKPSQLDAQTILATLPANTIDKIEIITAPSALYDADGRGGILNITTKVAKNQGFSLLTNASLGSPKLDTYNNDRNPQRHGIDFTLLYNKNKVDWSLSANYLRNDIGGWRVGDVWTARGSIITSFPSEGERSFERKTGGFRTSLAYALNTKNSLNFGYYLGIRKQVRDANIFYDLEKIEGFSSSSSPLFSLEYYNPNRVIKDNTVNVLSADFKHTFSKKSLFTLSALNELAKINSLTTNRNLRNLPVFSSANPLIQQSVAEGSLPLNALRLKADYELTTPTGKWSSGYQFRYQSQDGAFSYQETQKNGLLAIVPAFSADIKIENTIHALYTQYTGKKSKLEYALGLRYESSARDFLDQTRNTLTELDLNNLFPSANFLYALNKETKLKLGYSRRVQRATNNELNPYPEREHSETLEQGDPNIKPEFIGLYELGLSKDFKKGNTFFTLYSQQINNVINRVNSVYADSILNRIFTNAGKAQLWGGEAGLSINPSKKLKYYIGLNVYQLRINGALFNNTVAVNTKGIVYNINSNISYNLPKNMVWQGNLSYLSARKTAQGQDSRFYLPSTSLKKSIWNKKASIMLQWQNIGLGNMKPNQQSISTSGENFYTYTNYIQERNIFQINFNYIFNQTTKKANLPNSEFGEKEF